MAHRKGPTVSLEFFERGVAAGICSSAILACVARASEPQGRTGARSIVNTKLRQAVQMKTPAPRTTPTPSTTPLAASPRLIRR